jgi:CheY-like chemotaxis protein/predicted transcriptional regulator
MDTLYDRKGSFAIQIIERILDVLSENNKIKKTNLAGKTGLNYSSCVRYINLLVRLNWAIYRDGEVSITAIGRKYKTILSASADEVMAENFGLTPADFAAEGQLQAPRTSLSPSRNKKEGSYNIMLIDDEPDVLQTFSSFLKSRGYNVDAFVDPRKALYRFIAAGPSHYDLVITDIRMPELDGIKLCRHIKKIDSSARIMFVTALDLVEDLAGIFPDVELGNVLKKPIGATRFVEAVNEILGQKPHTAASGSINLN